MDWLIDWILTQADVKNPVRGHKVEKHHSEGKNVRRTLRRTLHTKRKRKWYKKYSEKAISPYKQKREKKKKRIHILATQDRRLHTYV